MSRHIALLGDSIFDNAAYTGDEPDVLSHLRAILPNSWKASLHAVDGATTNELAAQLAKVPRKASHLVISIGGNDVLLNSDLLALPVASTTEALELFAERVGRFELQYRVAIQEAMALGRDTTLCTIYNGNLDSEEARVARVALMTFNDVILRVAFEHALPVIDLRAVCDEPEDYANPIEPSGRGGRKIARAVARSCGALEGDASSSPVFVS